MNYFQKHAKRIATDVLGYLLILGGVAFGWLPGPGGIPLILAGLGLLSINNEWAARLRDYLLKHGGKAVQILFPPRAMVQVLYDILVIELLVLATYLAHRHAAIWEISVAIGLFFGSLFVAAMNRERYLRFKRKRK
ncbi:MAG: putative transrane protein [Candidatus Saccharibacteria bacterium]|nr:putative transrane protein [Candidatus Saccharibacteria bacterium]